MAEINLRELANSDLQDTLAGEWSLPVILISPDGQKQEHNALDLGLPIEERRALTGQVMMARKVFDPATGGDIVVGKPVVTLPVSSLSRVPNNAEPGEWICKAPAEPRVDAPKVTYRVGRPIEGGDGHAMIRLYLELIEQEAPA